MIDVIAQIPFSLWAAGLAVGVVILGMFAGLQQFVNYLTQRQYASTALGSGRDPRLTGTVGYYDIAVGQTYVCLTERNTQVLMTAEQGRWPFRRRQLWLEVVGAPGGLTARAPAGERSPVLTGDGSFDRQVRLHGDAMQVVSLMSYSARAALRDVVAMGGEVQDRVIRCRVPNTVRAATVRKRGRRMVDAHLALDEARRAGTATALSRLVRDDPDRGVRSTALALLKQFGTSNTIVSRELRLLSMALDGDERMEVGRVAGDVDFFLAIAEDREERGDLRADALVTAARIAGRLDGSMRRLCREFVDAPSPLLRTAALHACCVDGGEVYVEAAREWVREAMLVGGPRSSWLRDDGGASLGAAFDLLTVHGDWADVPLLLTALPELGHVAFRRALVTIQTHGTIDHVPELLQIAEASEPGRDDEVRVCVRELQAAVSVKAGAITVLSQGISGGLEVANGELGALELVGPDEGRRS